MVVVVVVVVVVKKYVLGCHLSVSRIF